MTQISNGKPAVLVLYFSRGVAQLPMRTAVEDHLRCWERHSRFPAIYHNYAFGFDWEAYAGLPLAGIVLDTLALNLRWDPELFWRKSTPLRAIRAFKGPKIAMPQDEFIHTDVLCDFLVEVGATHVLSAGTRATAEQIYRRRLPRARLESKLTGYLEAGTLETVEALAEAAPERSVDVGYRAWHAEPWLGEHGRLKVRVAEEALARAARFPELRFDVSTDEGATFVGTGWYEFLLRCRATLGAEGGASVLDRDGAIRARTHRYVAQHPGASFEEIREACFPGQDGSLRLFAIGPRHLEACATRTCQVLVEGEYQGILRPNLDYLPIRRDFSNLDEILGLLARRDPAVEAVAASAHERVVRSGLYTYASFVRRVEERILAPWHRRPFLARPTAAEALAIDEAIARHREVEAFARHEALDLLPHRQAYETSEAPGWRAEREAAARLAERHGITLSPD